MANFLFYLAAFLIALGILVVVHEFGHYAVARLCGVKVLRFAVGFGRVLWSRRAGSDQTEWALCAIPLGGYVKMVDEREAPVPEHELPRAFNRQTLAKRAAIVLAGPLANLILAAFLYWVLFMHGVEELRPVLAAPSVQTAASIAGIRGGETVLSVDGREIATWEELRWAMLKSLVDGTPVDLVLKDVAGATHQVSVVTSSVSAEDLEKDPLGLLGLSLNRPKLPPIVGTVLPDSPASLAGIQAGDQVLTINGTEIQYWGDLTQVARQSPGKVLKIELDRAGQVIGLTVTPASIEERGVLVGRLGLAAKDNPALREGMFIVARYDALTAAGRAIRQTWETSIFTLRMIGRMLIGELSWKNLSGPVTIADYAGQSAQLGFSYYLKFLAMISISIGVLNLLPIPVLDGGHLMYYLAEFLRGKPLPERAIELGQRVGLMLLMVMMGFAIFNDINRHISG